MAERTVVAIDLGGTKTTVALVTDRGGVLARSTAPSPRVAPRTAVDSFLTRARQLPGFEGAVAVGLALPAIVDDDGRVSWAAPSAPEWDGVFARGELEAAFGMPASVQFDGYAATRGEATFGGERGARSMVTIIVGTGMGAGVWIDGQVVRGVAGVAGAVGWNRWPVGEGGLSDRAESVASGPGILAAARRGDPAAAYPDTRAVFRAAHTGDRVARAAIAEAATIAGTVAGGAIDLIAPEVVVWTGGVGSRADFSTAATRIARRCCQPFAARRTRFVRSRLGAESSLIGAAAGALAALEGRSGT